MSGFLPVARATALETMSEPLSLLLLLGALVVTPLTSAFHFHQFGDPTRMARDAGLSSLLVFGILFAVTGAVRTVRRELETRTASVALAHPVSRTVFFLGKLAGVALAWVGFAAASACVTLTVVTGAAFGGAIAARTGEVARMWGPSLAAAIAPSVLSLVGAAVLNRFARFRFTLTATMLALALAVLSPLVGFDSGWTVRLMPVLLLAALPGLVFLCAAGAAAVRFRTNAAGALLGVLAAAALPAFANYARSGVLADGGALDAGYFALAFGAALAAAAGFGVLGVAAFRGVEV